MLHTSLTQSATTRNTITPAVWGEYQLRQNPTLYSAVWNCSDGAILGWLKWEPATGFYFDPAMTADKDYIPAFDDWAAYISADVDTLNALARGQNSTEGNVTPPPTKRAA